MKNNSKQSSEASEIFVEIRAGEGGKDAKLLVDTMLGIYGKFCKMRSL